MVVPLGKGVVAGVASSIGMSHPIMGFGLPRLVSLEKVVVSGVALSVGQA